MGPTTSSAMAGVAKAELCSCGWTKWGAMREKTSNYKRMQERVKEWADLSMKLERQERASQQKHGDRSN
jgi:hypothetical protein